MAELKKHTEFGRRGMTVRGSYLHYTRYLFIFFHFHFYFSFFFFLLLCYNLPGGWSEKESLAHEGNRLRL